MSNIIGIGENPQQPSFVAETFIPDQLIAGRKQLVTQPITLGSGTLQRGSVLGQISEGIAAQAAGVAAAGTFTFAGVPAVGDTLSIAGTTVTFIANGVQTNGNNFSLGNTPEAPFATVQAFLDAFVPFLSGSADTNLVKATYSAAGNVLTATAATSGTGGNSLALAETSAQITVSGATMAGGAANTGNPTFSAITRGGSFKLGAYKMLMTAATTFTLTDPNGDALPGGTFGTAYNDAQLSFTATAGGTPCVAGDSFLIQATAGSGAYVLSVKTATDGSQVPSAVLVDFADASAGPVNTGAYVAGEFNANAILFDPSWTVATLTTALRQFSIYVKSSVSAADPYGE